MADIKTAMQVYLLTIDGITDLVGDRIGPDALPQGETLPAITLTKISGGSQQHLSGPSGWAEPRIQSECYATTSTEAEALDTQVRLAMQNGGWNTGAQTEMGGIVVGGVVWEEQFTRYDEATDGGEEARYVAISDVFISHAEEIAA